MPMRSLGREQESERVGEISNVSHFTDSPTGQELTTDHINIGLDPPKMLSYQPVGNQGIFEGQEQCLHSRVGSVVVSRPVRKTCSIFSRPSLFPT